MRRLSATVFATVAVATLGGALLTGMGGVPFGTIVHVTSAGNWGGAEEVPNSGTLNSGGKAEISSVACASAGECSAAGYYTDGSGLRQALVANETNGHWGGAEEVPNSGTLNAGGNAEINWVSCASAGNCSAGGSYSASVGNYQAFVVNETNGTWGEAEEVPNSGTLNVAGNAAIDSVSCASAGNCSAGGYYKDGFDQLQALVVNETNGTWGKAKEVPHSGALNTGGNALVGAVSCTSPGSCSAGGIYAVSVGDNQAFVVNETRGIWGKAEEAPDSGTLNAGGNAEIYSVSCASAGNCSAGGYYADASSHEQALVVNETRGIWGKAEEVPNSAKLNAGGIAAIESISCASAGNCSAGGRYAYASHHYQAFVVNETRGIWGKAEEVPNSGTLNASGDAYIGSISCASAGNCSAGGYYADAFDNEQALVVNETNGTWRSAEKVPHSGALNAGGIAAVVSMSCAAAGTCTAGGIYYDGSHHQQAFVASYTPRPTVTALSPTSGTHKGGTVVTVHGSNFNGASKVRFGSKAGTHIVVLSGVELRVRAPTGSGTVNVTVTTAGGTSAVSVRDRYRYT